MLAAAGMRDMMCFKYTVRQVITVAFALCRPPGKCDHFVAGILRIDLTLETDDTYSLTSACGQLIRTVIAPQMALIAQMSSALDSQKFRLFFPGKEGGHWPFRDVQGTLSKLKTFDVKYVYFKYRCFFA